MNHLQLTPIGFIHTKYPGKFGIPRQSGLENTLESYIRFEGACRNADCLRGLEEYSHLWLLWGFSENPAGAWHPTVRPPRLGGKARRGVFATRSPFRPNPIGLSSVALQRIDLSDPSDPLVYVSGADLMDHTPIYDIKPYLAYTDSHPQAKGSFSSAALGHRLAVCCEDTLVSSMAKEEKEALFTALSLDPRPSYQDDPDRIYGMYFSKYNVKFKVCGDVLTVISVDVETLKIY